MTDSFYWEINAEVFYQWIILNKDTYLEDGIDCHLHFSDQYRRIIHLETKEVLGVVTIYYNHLCEEQIYKKKDDSQLFYLHYAMVNMKQCCTLFHEFYHVLKNYTIKKPYHILLCCSTGLTTGIFAGQLQELIQLEKANYKIQAIAYSEIEFYYHDNDAIYLAPQVAYLLPDAIILTDKEIPIYEIPATIFATADVKAFLNILKKNHHK